jgi:hypothetical protein
VDFKAPTFIQRHLYRPLSKLDAGIDAYIENKLIASGATLVGTFLFLLFFLMFTGAFGVVVITGLVVGGLEAGLIVGLNLLHARYGEEDSRDKRMEIADAIEAFMTKTDVFSDWEGFLANPIDDHPQLEEIRVRCTRLGKEHPSELPGDFCSPQGIEVLETYVRTLRAGAATRFLQAIRERKSKARLAVDSVPAPAWETPVEGGDAEPEPPPLAPQAAPHKQEPKAAKQARKAEQKAAQLATRKKPKKAVKKKALGRKAKRRSGTDTTASTRPDPGATAFLTDAGLTRPVSRRSASEPPARTEPAPRSGGLSEAGAIQKIMAAGFTAHDYDRKQQQLLKARGKEPAPAEVVRDLLQASKGKKKIAKASAPKLPGQMLTVQKKKVRRRRRLRGTRVVMLLFLALPAAPFVAWRVPDGDAVALAGEIRYQVPDPASDPVELARAQFESLFGNKGVSIVGGPLIYLSDGDYQRCWSQSKKGGGDTPFTIHIKAKARPLFFGGYDVAELLDVEVHLIDQPMVVTHESPRRKDRRR